MDGDRELAAWLPRRGIGTITQEGAVEMQRPNRYLAGIIVVIISLMTSAELGAWGNDGHKIVGEIAWQELTPEARSKLRTFLPQGTFGTLYSAATWPDVYARQYERYDWLKPFHYIESDASSSDIGATRLSCSDCVVQAIKRFSDQMIDDSESYYLRVNALRFVAHFVGDVHQPLHTGHPDRQGGNRTDVRFDGNWLNLHKVWDTALIRRHLGEIAAAASEDTWERNADFGSVPDLNWEEYARLLLAEISEADRVDWRREMDPAAWAEESFDLMKQHCASIKDGEKLPTDYYKTTIPVVSLRLKQAGIRLGTLLNGLATELE